MNDTALRDLVNDIAHRCSNAETPSYFDCLEALDELEFHILDPLDLDDDISSEMSLIRDQAAQLHTRLAAIAQASMDALVADITAHRLTAPELKRLFNQYADALSDTRDKPDYDFFDDFLIHLFRVDYEPSETRPRTPEMLYLQPTPGRIILDMLNQLPFTAADRFYDLGSGLGRVVLPVALLTDAHAVGIEYEQTYVEYACRSARKLGLTRAEFRNRDVREADFSDGTIFFMYTPFNGSILRNVLNRLRDLSAQRPITVCSYGPCTIAVEQEKWLTAVRHSKGEIDRLAIFSAG